MTILMLSQGVPMLYSGDEVLRSQKGNNNAYCQDNPLGWFDWTLVEKNSDMLRFVKQIIAFRKRHPSLRRTRFLTGKTNPGGLIPDIIWHGTRLLEPAWFDSMSQVLAFTLAAAVEGEEELHVILNMSDQVLNITPYNIEDRKWHVAVDTWQPSPGDILEPHQQTSLEGNRYEVHSRTVVVLEARR
jgi:glycogen operon protein